MLVCSSVPAAQDGESWNDDRGAADERGKCGGAGEHAAEERAPASCDGADARAQAQHARSATFRNRALTCFEELSAEYSSTHTTQLSGGL